MIKYFLFTKLHKYPEYDEVHKIMQGGVQKDKYTLEVHSEMKTMYENLYNFLNGIKRKRIIQRYFVWLFLL